jgi:magnesium transporter
VRVLTTFERAEIERLRERGEFFWLDLEAPGADDVATLGETFGFFHLAIEDTTKFGQRPKLEEFGDHVFVVFFGASRDGMEVKPLEVHLYVSGSYLITVRREHCAQLEALRRWLEQRHEPEQRVVYRVFDALTDSFFPVLEGMDDEIDELEDTIVREPGDEELQRVFHLKRDLVVLRRVVGPQRDLFARAFDEIVGLPGLEPGTRNYFRDVYDHLIRISEQIDSNRDLLTSTMDVYLSTVSNRLNQVMKQLTLVATVFLPLTFVTGFFGQNFRWMVEHVDTFGAFLVFGVGASAAAIAGLLYWFRRSGYT